MATRLLHGVSGDRQVLLLCILSAAARIFIPLVLIAAFVAMAVLS
jgi:hypothetical protein